MSESIFFIFFITAYGGMGIGQIIESEFNNWRQSNFKLEVLYPKRFNLVPMANKRTQEIMGYKMHIAPMQMHKTVQEKLYIDIAEIEILGEVESEDNIINCKGNEKELFSIYLEAIQQWKSELSGLSVASPEETANILKSNTIPFPGKRK